MSIEHFYLSTTKNFITVDSSSLVIKAWQSTQTSYPQHINIMCGSTNHHIIAGYEICIEDTHKP
jgi:hypothetical protein